MATVDYTFTWLSDAQGMADDGSSAKIAVSWESADGNPANGCLKWVGTSLGPGDSAATKQESATQSVGTNTWEDLGVPVGGVVTAVELLDLEERTASASIAGSIEFNKFTIHDASGTNILAGGGGDLFSGSSGDISSDSTWTQLVGPGPSVGNVDASYRASNTDIRLRALVITVPTASGNFDTRLDSFRIRITYTPPPTFPPSIDICCTHPGKHICYRNDTNVLVYSTFDEGASWSVALIATDAGDESTPTIAADHRDNLYVAYHTNADVVRIHKSPDWGDSWALWRTMTGGRFPRMRFGGEGSAQGAGQERAYLAVWATGSTSLLLFDSDDYLATTGSALLTLAVAEQTADLGVDRRGRVYLFYSTGGSIYRRDSGDGVTWEGPDLIATGGCPAFGLYYPFGILLWFDGVILYGWPTTSDYQGFVGSPIAITMNIDPQCLGLTVDRRDNPWVVWIEIPDPVPTPPDYPQLRWAPGRPVNVPGDAPGLFTFDPGDAPQLGFGAEEITSPPPKLDAVETVP